MDGWGVIDYFGINDDCVFAVGGGGGDNGGGGGDGDDGEAKTKN